MTRKVAARSALLLLGTLLANACRPAGELVVTEPAAGELLFHVEGSSEEGRCIRELAIYRLGPESNYTEQDAMVRANSKASCARQVRVRNFEKPKRRGPQSIRYRAVSRNGIYVFSTDFNYPLT